MLNPQDTLDDGDELAALFNGTAKAAKIDSPTDFVPVLDRVYVEKCKSCHGRGRFISYAGRDCGPCFKCKGKGERAYKTPAGVRADNRVNTAARKERKAQEAVDAFRAAHPAIAQWLDVAGDFAFAVAMRDALAKWGQLTPNQIAACDRCIAGREKALVARAEREANAPEVSIGKIEDAFKAALASGLRYPALALDVFTFKPAGENSKNAGSIYVTQAGEYLGKVTSGRFICTAACGDDRKAKVLAVAADPEAAAIAYGKMTGACSCCGRELTNAESVKRGIGPICAMRYGW